MLTRYFDKGMDMTPLVKDSLVIYPYEKYKNKRNSSMFWANTLVTVLVGTADAALSKDTPDDRFWARKHTEDMIDEGEAQRGIEMLLGSTKATGAPTPSSTCQSTAASSL